MKVLIFMTQFYQLSGAERLAVELAERLNRRGIHADILSMYTADLPGVAEAKRTLLNLGIPSVYFLGMKIHPPITSLLPSILKLRQLIKEQRYDIVETSSLSPSVITAWATWGTRVRYVAGLHHVFKKNRDNTKRHKFWRLSLLCHPSIRYYAISDYVSQHWLEYSGTSPKYTRLIYNGIPNDCFDAKPARESVCEELGMPSEGKIILFVGRMLKRKGIDTILDSLGQICHSENLYLLYVGGWDQPEGYWPDEAGLLERMKEKIICEGWSDNIRILGPRNDVPRLMASSDLLVHPARIEGFGLVLAEAMAAGLPVVASNVDGIPEVLNGTDSMMVAPNDPGALREAVLQSLTRSPGERTRATKKGHTRALDFRTATRTDAIIKLFEDVLSEHF